MPKIHWSMTQRQTVSKGEFLRACSDVPWSMTNKSINDLQMAAVYKHVRKSVLLDLYKFAVHADDGSTMALVKTELESRGFTVPAN